MRSRRDRRGSSVRLLAAVMLLPAGALHGQAPPPEQEPPVPATECCLVLLVPVGARAAALGGTMTARGSADAVFRNPAGLATLERGVFVIHHGQDFFGQSDAFSLLFAPPVVGAVGLSYQLIDHGEIEATDDSGQMVGLLSLRSHVLVASFATGIAGGLAAGLSYKLFHERHDCTGACGALDVAATTHGLDAGVRYRPVWLPALELGASVENLGFALQVVNAAQADPMPARVHAGAAYDVLAPLRRSDDLTLHVGVDLIDEWHDPGSPAASVGAEFAFQQLLFLRGGYVQGEGLGTGAALGLGLHWDRFILGLTRSFMNTRLAETDPFQVTFGVTF